MLIYVEVGKLSLGHTKQRPCTTKEEELWAVSQALAGSRHWGAREGFRRRTSWPYGGNYTIRRRVVIMKIYVPLGECPLDENQRSAIVKCGRSMR